MRRGTTQRRTPRTGRTALAAAVLAGAAALGCARSATRGPSAFVDVVVIAPHPDDEVLMAGEVLRRAVDTGQRAAVIVLTNGDLGCFADRHGSTRQAETVRALAALGLPEDAVHFLGYPDGHLAELGPSPLPPVAWRAPDGTCTTRSATTAERGAGRADEHTRRTGRPAPFTAAALTEDLAAVLERLGPRDVYLPHDIDQHPDHAATPVFFRRALARLSRGPVTAHRAVVHAGPCWPSDCAHPFGPEEAVPPLPAPLAGYLPPERVPCDGRRKLELIAHYASQRVGPVADDWLAGFARRDEPFYPETLRRDARGRWAAAEARHLTELLAVDGAQVALESGATLTVRVEDARVAVISGDGPSATWPLVGARPPFTLLVSTRPNAAGFAEWGLWGTGPEFAGTRVLPDVPRAVP